MNKKPVEFWFILIPSIVILGTIIAIGIRGHINANDINFDKLGGLGGFIGGIVGTSLTILATLYVYKTYTSQKNELEEQRKLMSIQQFENTFFNLLNVHRELKNNLKLSRNDCLFTEDRNNIERRILHGSEVIAKISYDFEKMYKTCDEIFIFGQAENNTFSDVVNQLINEDFREVNINDYLNDPINPKPELNFGDVNWDENNNSKEYHLKKIKYLFKLLFKNYQNQISHYCRNIYHILKFIYENETRESDKEVAKEKFKQYANLFQSQLSVSEQLLLFYNFIDFDDFEDKKENSTISLVNHYKFLENIGIENLILKKHEEFYNFRIKGSDRII